MFAVILGIMHNRNNFKPPTRFTTLRISVAAVAPAYIQVSSSHLYGRGFYGEFIATLSFFA